MRTPTKNPWNRRAAIAGLGALALVACSSMGADSVPGREGNLGHGIFGYQCQSESDPTCPVGTDTMPGCSGALVTSTTATKCFPSAVAQGGRFRIHYLPGQTTNNVGNPNIGTVSEDYLSAAGDGLFQALKPGYAGVVARSSVTIEVVDYTLIKITPIASLRIQDASGKSTPPSLPMTKGATASYKLVALGKASEQLAGAFDYSWSSSNLTVVRLNQGNPTASMTIEALAPGTATLTATSDGKIKATLDIMVTQ